MSATNGVEFLALPGLDGSLGALGLTRAGAAATGEHVPGPGLACAVFRPASPPRRNEHGGTLGVKPARVIVEKP